MQALGSILQSYQSVNVEEAAIEFRVTILSRDHVKKLAKLRKQKKLPINILQTNSDDEEDLVGGFDDGSNRRKKKGNVSVYLLSIGAGFPARPTAFRSNCLLVSVAAGILYHEAQMESDPKKRKYKERCVTYINSACKKNKISRQNFAGYNILQRCKELLVGLDGVSLEGPHPYKILHQLVQKTANSCHCL